jgi:hypothetical protein
VTKREKEREVGVNEYVFYCKKIKIIRLWHSLTSPGKKLSKKLYLSIIDKCVILTGFALEVRLVEFLLFDGTSTSECSTVQPIARRAFKDSLTGSL